ncbi:tyrosine-type recombinase/integrase [Pseudomonadota bacterium]
MPLTDTKIRNLKPTSKSFKMFDGGGLYIEVQPAGGKWWRLKYRYENKEKRISLGTYPDVTLKDARGRRDDARKLLANGINPSQHRQVLKAAKMEQAENTFEAVAREWHTKMDSNWAESHSKKVIGRLEKNVFPWLGGTPVAQINSPQLLGVIRRIEERGKLETAHRVLRICGQIFRYAVATGRTDRDPSGDLRGALPPVKTQHLAAVTEPAKVAEVLRAIEGYQGTLVVYCAMRLAPLVFVRPGELRQAEWAGIDLEEAEWRFTVSKTETQHIVPLSRQAVDILRELHPLTGNGRYVFPSARSPRGDRPMSDNAVLSALRALGISKEEMTGHGFRAIARTLLDEELGFRPDYIEHQLAHAVRDPNGRAYNRTSHLPERRKMMQEWADYLDKLRQIEPI